MLLIHAEPIRSRSGNARASGSGCSHKIAAVDPRFRIASARAAAQWCPFSWQCLLSQFCLRGVELAIGGILVDDRSRSGAEHKSILRRNRAEPLRWRRKCRQSPVEYAMPAPAITPNACRRDNICMADLHSVNASVVALNSIAKRHRHRCVAIVRFRDDARRGKFFGMQVPSPQQWACRETSVNAYLGHIVIRRSTCWKRKRSTSQISPSMAFPSTFSRCPKPSPRSYPPRKVAIISASARSISIMLCNCNNAPDFRAAYRRARFVTADGFPIVVLSRLLGTRIERTTGADLVEPICREAGKKGLPIFLLGSNEWTLATTARRLSERYQRLAGRRALCPRLAFRSLFERSGLRGRQHPRLRRQTLLRRARRAATGTVRGALSR